MSFHFQLLRKQREPQKRERQRAFSRAQAFHNKFRRQFADRFMQIIDEIESRITDELVEAAAEAQSAEAIIQAIPIGVYAPLTKSLEPQGFPTLHPTHIADLVKQDDLPDLSFDEMTEILLSELVRRKAELEVSVMLDKLKLGGQAVTFRFDIVNPHTLSWLRTHRLELIREIKDSTERSIRNLITTAIDEGVDARTTARRIRETVGLTQNQQGTITRLRTTLEAEGVPKRQVTKLVDAARRRKVRQRADLIARTEITRAESQGQLDAWRLAREDGLLDSATLKRWVAGGRADAICRALHDANPVPVDANFSTSFGEFFAPPAHPGCRCTLVLATVEDLTTEEAAAVA